MVRSLRPFRPSHHHDPPTQDFPLTPREPVVLSVGQFRPEKDHPLQIRAFARFLRARPPQGAGGKGKKGKDGDAGGVKLVMLGSCRGPEDEARVAALRCLVAEEGIKVRVGVWSG